MFHLEPTTLDERRLTRLAGLLRRVFPHATTFSREYLEWMYFRNPDGAVVGFEAVVGDEAVGHYAVVPIRVLHDGAVRRAGLAVNIAIDAAHRGHGLFHEITGAAHEAFAATGRDLVVGVANAQSTERFVRKLGFRLVGPLHARIGLAGRRPDLAAVERARFRRLWTPESFAWRFSNPSSVYRFERRRGAVRVFTPTRRFGIEAEMGVFPLDWAPPRQSRAYPLLRNPAKVWMGLRAGGGGHWPLTVEIPRSLRPSPLNLILKDTSATADPTPADGIDFRGADFDPY